MKFGLSLGKKWDANELLQVTELVLTDDVNMTSGDHDVPLAQLKKCEFQFSVSKATFVANFRLFGSGCHENP